MCDSKEMREFGWEEKDNLPGVYVPISNPHQEIFKKIEELLKRFEVSPSLRADWEGTNHFELTDDHGRLWLDVEDAFKRLPDGKLALSDDTEAGQRLGFCLEAAALVAEIGRIWIGKQ